MIRNKKKLVEASAGQENSVEVIQDTAIVENPKEIPTTYKAENMSVENLIQSAITNKVPVETMERLLAMRKELKAEYAKEQFDEAMAKFQGECPVIEKTKAGGQTQSGKVAYYYAPLDVIVKQVKESIQSNGFSYMVKTETKNDGVKVTVIVKHKSGHSEPTDVEVPLGTKTGVMSASQVTASALTFAKRYAFCNAFGILTGDEDDDAQQTKNVPSHAETTPKTQNYANNSTNSQVMPQTDWKKLKISEMQHKKLFAQLKALGKDKEWFETIIEEKTQGTIIGIENLNRGWASTFIDVFEKKLKDPQIKKVEANLPSVDIDDVPNYQEESVEDSGTDITHTY